MNLSTYDERDNYVNNVLVCILSHHKSCLYTVHSNSTKWGEGVFARVIKRGRGGGNTGRNHGEYLFKFLSKHQLGYHKKCKQYNDKC